MWSHFDTGGCPGQAVGVRTRLDNAVSGFIPLKNLSDKHVANPEERVQVSCLAAAACVYHFNFVIVILKYIFTGMTAQRAALPVLFLLTGRSFAPQGRHIAPIKVKFGRSTPCQISSRSDQGCGFTAPKL